MADLALLLQLLERAELIGQRNGPMRCSWIRSMRSTRRCGARAPPAGSGRPVTERRPDAGALPREAGLGGDDQAVGVGVQGLGDDLLADERP